MSPKTRIINTVHDSRDYPSYSKAKIAFSNELLDFTIAISECVKQTILSHGVSDQKIITIYNAIDTSKFQPENSQDKVNRSNRNNKSTQSNETRNNVIIGNVARFFPEKKGQDTLVRAMDLITSSTALRGDNYYCYFAGAVFKGQEEEFSRIQYYVHQHHLGDRVFFLGNVEDIPTFLHQLNLFVLPSNYEGFGIALIEALACGVPVVASDLEGPKEIFQLAKKDHIKIGNLCPPGNPESLAATIKETVQNCSSFKPEELYEFVKRHFSIEASIEQHLILYKRLLEKMDTHEKKIKNREHK